MEVSTIVKLDQYTQQTSRGIIYGFWACKRAFKQYSQPYPENFLKRVYYLFEIEPDINKRIQKVCHLFSGTIEEPYTVDLNPLSKAKFIEDATNTHFKDKFFDLTLVDPPYTEERAKTFGFKLPTIKSILYEARRITKISGYYCLLHFIVARDWFKERKGVIAVTEGANMRIRAFNIFQRRS